MNQEEIASREAASQLDDRFEPRTLALKGKRFTSLTPTLSNKSHSSVDHSSFDFGPFRGESATVRGQNTDNQAPTEEDL